MSTTWKIIFAVSGALALAACLRSPALLPYPLLVLASLCRWRLPQVGPPALRLLLATLLGAVVLEIGAWLDNFIRNPPEPALFHPQLIPDLIIAAGFYAAWWLAWWLMLRSYRFTAPQVFIVMGIYGVLIEQQGGIFLAGLAALPWSLALWLFVAVAYGAAMTLAFTLARDGFNGARNGWLKYPLAWAALLVLTLIMAAGWEFALKQAQVIPPKKLPMREYPFW